MLHIDRFLTSRRTVFRLARLFAGLFAYGIAIALILRAGLGGSPWDVLGQGVAHALGLTFGASTLAISIVVLVLWIPLRQRPGWGTLANSALIGVFADLGLAWLPQAASLPLWLPAAEGLFLAGGLTLLAFASALYIGAGLGPGPRDGLMTGLVARTGWPVWAVRCAIEVSVTAGGWLLGGTVGIGTAVFALAIGPLVQLAVRALRVDLGGSRQRETGRAAVEVSAGAAR
ncbi:MAG: hypothetical protein HOQ07_13050 [Sinomonas sp.]|nr:hypothetical protein [Sinomonas sp.]